MVQNGGKFAFFLAIVATNTKVGILGLSTDHILDLADQCLLHATNVYAVKRQHTGQIFLAFLPLVFTVLRSVVTDIESHYIEGLCRK
ncbi:MAG: hypothetical protein IPO07_24855 [Haliscomenobacter sp.]|nr:hypothetical protein [Haliscomenobacter sp.]MBK9491669.1 hypothetical protein [Haliscomenobacter sp.]